MFPFIFFLPPLSILYYYNGSSKFDLARIRKGIQHYILMLHGRSEFFVNSDFFDKIVKRKILNILTNLCDFSANTNF
jgi:hypothetical protein